MDFKIIERQNTVPDYDKTAIKLTHIDFYPDDEMYEGKEITENVISKILDKISIGIDVFLYLDEYGETDFLNVISDGKWISLMFYNCDMERYCSYNKDFEDTEEYCPLLIGGQSPVEKYLTVKDMKEGIEAVEYFIRTGELYTKIDWIKQE